MTNAIHFHFTTDRTEMVSTKRTQTHVKNQVNQYIKLAGILRTYIHVSMGISKAGSALLVAQGIFRVFKRESNRYLAIWRQSYLRNICNNIQSY